jgi:hypothetical protein
VHVRMRSFNSGSVIRRLGSRSNILHKISFNSSDNGSIVFKKLRFLVNALYVESSVEACFQGFLPQVRLTRTTPRDQISLGAHRYLSFFELWSRHSGDI